MLFKHSLKCVQVLSHDSGEWRWSQGPTLNKARYGHCVMQVSLANHSEVHLFQMADGQVVIVGGHDDQGVLDSVELMNLTNPAEVANLSTIILEKTLRKFVDEKTI